MNQVNSESFKKHMKEAMNLIKRLLLTKRDKMNSITKEYVDRLLEASHVNPKDFDIDYEHIWSYVIGFCYGRKAGKEGIDKNGVDRPYKIL